MTQPNSYDLEIFNQIINEKLRQDAQNHKLTQESFKIAQNMMETAKKKSARDLRSIIVQLPKIFNENQDKSLKECLNLQIYL